jgi:hypothetical protein
MLIKGCSAKRPVFPMHIGIAQETYTACLKTKNQIDLKYCLYNTISCFPVILLIYYDLLSSLKKNASIERTDSLSQKGFHFRQREARATRDPRFGFAFHTSSHWNGRFIIAKGLWLFVYCLLLIVYRSSQRRQENTHYGSKNAYLPLHFQIYRFLIWVSITC